jgi:hypothetical protein
MTRGGRRRRGGVRIPNSARARIRRYKWPCVPYRSCFLLRLVVRCMLHCVVLRCALLRRSRLRLRPPPPAPRSPERRRVESPVVGSELAAAASCELRELPAPGSSRTPGGPGSRPRCPVGVRRVRGAAGGPGPGTSPATAGCCGGQWPGRR